MLRVVQPDVEAGYVLPSQPSRSLPISIGGRAGRHSLYLSRSAETAVILRTVIFLAGESYR